MNYFVGIDNSSFDHKVRIIDENGKLHDSFTIANNYNGFKELGNKLVPYSRCTIGFELPHGPLVDYLHLNHYHLFSINPLKIKRYKETLKVSGNKNDDIDAMAIAEYAANNESRMRELLFNSCEIEKLKALSIIHTRVTHDKSRHLNKLHFCLSQYFPLHNGLFSDFGCTVQLELIIKYPTFLDLQGASDNELQDFLKAHNYRRQIYIDRLLQKIRVYTQLITEESEYANKIEAEYLCKTLGLLNEELSRLEKEMSKTTDAHRLGKYFKSLPGAGKILSCKMLALLGDEKNRFENANSVQCFYGTAPKNYQSGQYHKVMMRRACNKLGRVVFHTFAFSSMRLSPWAREYYDNQRSRGKTHSVAVRSLANKWIKIIFRIWKNEVFYDESLKSRSAA